MFDEWSTQRAQGARVCSVLAMHVPNLGIHTSRGFPCASIHFSFFFTGQKRKWLLMLASL